jgi:hypothetical protein
MADTANIDAPTVAVVNALYPSETLDEIPPIPNDIRVETARRAIRAYLAATPPHSARCDRGDPMTPTADNDTGFIETLFDFKADHARLLREQAECFVCGRSGFHAHVIGPVVTDDGGVA